MSKFTSSFTHFKDMVLDEQTWKKFERTQTRKERPRLIRSGIIKPNINGVQAYPQLFEKSGDEWNLKLGYSNNV